MAVTIKDIANLAGVSKTTVSKIINKKDENISKETKQRVLTIMKAQNYTPNKLAQSLTTKKTKTIGLIIPDIRNPFFTDISRGVEDYARDKGYNIIFSNTDENEEREIESINMLCDKMIDGLILAPSSNTIKLKQHSKNNIPIVLVDKNIENNFSQIKGIVKIDNKNGTYNSTKHLIKKGHKEILYLSGPLKTDIANQRLNGYIRSHEKNNLEYKKEHVIEGSYKHEFSYEYIKNLEEINFTAICCANDLIAIGAIRALKERKLKIPKDISIVGFDDIQTCTLINPQLTTIRQPAYDMGKCACEILINYLENKSKNEIEEIIFKPNLVIRKSTKELKRI